MRVENLDEFERRLNQGDTLTLGVDYYALTGVSSMYFSPQFLNENREYLLDGNVIVFRIAKGYGQRIL
jgi:hypothetical protein